MKVFLAYLLLGLVASISNILPAFAAQASFDCSEGELIH